METKAIKLKKTNFSIVKTLALLTSIIMLGLDRYTKQIVLDNLIYTKTYPVWTVLSDKLNFGLNWFLTFNYGTAFSFIKTAEGNTFSFILVFSIVITLGVIYWLYQEDSKNKLNILAAGCIIGGALGNIYDRINYGFVVDFIDVYAGVYHWPVFNVADIAISIGVMLLLWNMIFDKEQ